MDTSTFDAQPFDINEAPAPGTEPFWTSPAREYDWVGDEIELVHFHSREESLNWDDWVDSGEVDIFQPTLDWTLVGDGYEYQEQLGDFHKRFHPPERSFFGFVIPGEDPRELHMYECKPRSLREGETLVRYFYRHGPYYIHCNHSSAGVPFSLLYYGEMEDVPGLLDYAHQVKEKQRSFERGTCISCFDGLMSLSLYMYALHEDKGLETTQYISYSYNSSKQLISMGFGNE